MWQDPVLPAVLSGQRRSWTLNQVEPAKLHKSFSLPNQLNSPPQLNAHLIRLWIARKLPIHWVLCYRLGTNHYGWH